MSASPAPNASLVVVASVEAFLVAFDQAPLDSFGPAQGATARAIVDSLQELFLTAVVDCRGPPEVCKFLCQLHRRLDGLGAFAPVDGALGDVGAKGPSAIEGKRSKEAMDMRDKWTWLTNELRLLAGLDSRRIDERARQLLKCLEERVGCGNDPRVGWESVEASEGETAAAAERGSAVANVAENPSRWDMMSRFVRDNSRQTLRRFVSGESDASHDRNSAWTESARQRTTSDDKGVPLLQRNSSVVSDRVPMMLRSLSSMMGLGVEETFLCQICFEHAPVSTAVELGNCKHRFCIACFKMYLELKIAEGQVYPSCFHEVEEVDVEGEKRKKACGASVLPSEIESLVAPEVWKKYLTFKFNKENECGRQCPYCEHSQLCEGPESPECVCVNCKKTFCFTHGNAHPDGSCADYELQQLESDKINRSAIAEFSKPCPGCNASVEKNGGCNHMKCIVCNTDFCWICGAIVENATAPTHFQWWNVTGCAGQQMDDVDNQTPAERFWWGVFRFAYFVILGPPALVITIALTLLSCFCIPCTRTLDTTFSNAFTSCLNFVAMGLFFLILGLMMIAAFLIGLIFELLQAPFKALGCCRDTERIPPGTEPDPDSSTAPGAPDNDVDLEAGGGGASTLAEHPNQATTAS